jgi:hypothetical protein
LREEGFLARLKFQENYKFRVESLELRVERNGTPSPESISGNRPPERRPPQNQFQKARLKGGRYET